MLLETKNLGCGEKTGGYEMIFETAGSHSNPAILFFHAMGVTGKSSIPVAKHLKEDFYCIMPTATVYCADQKYTSRYDEIRQVEQFLEEQGVKELALVVASSMGADLATAFLFQTKIPVGHVFFDGGQFVRMSKSLRHLTTPFLFLAMKSLYWSKGKTLKKILWCDDDKIKPYFIEAGKNLTYKNLWRQLSDSLEDKPFPVFSEELQKHTFWEFGSIEDHFKYREDVRDAYKYGNFPVFKGYNHMQYQIRDPKGFAKMLRSVMEKNELPNLEFLQ